MPRIPRGLILNAIGGTVGYGQQSRQNRRANAETRRAQASALDTNTFGTQDLQEQINSLGVGLNSDINKANADVLYGSNTSMPQSLQGYLGRSNAARDYQDITTNNLQAGYNQRLNDVLGEINGLGASAQNDINRSAQQMTGAVTNDLISRGLTGTTILPTARMGVEAARQRNTDSLNEQLRRERAGTIAALSGDTLNAYGQNRNVGLNTLLGTSGDYLGALDTTNTRTIGNTASTNAAFLNAEGNRITNEIGLRTNPNFLPQGPGAPNIGDTIASFGNTVTANRYAAYDPPSNTGAVIAGALGSAGISGGSTAASAAILGNYLSSKKYKDDHGTEDSEDSLDAIRRIPVKRWNYKGDSEEHVGPMAEDYAEETGRGDGNSINVADMLGTMMNSIKALDKKVSGLRRSRRK